MLVQKKDGVIDKLSSKKKPTTDFATKRIFKRGQQVASE